MAGFPRNFGCLAPAKVAADAAKTAARIAAAAPVVEAVVEEPVPVPVQDLHVDDIEDGAIGPAPTECDRTGVEPQTDNDDAPVRTTRLEPMPRYTPTFMTDPVPEPVRTTLPPLVRPWDPVAEKLKADRKAQMIADCAALGIPADYPLRSREQQQTLFVLQDDLARAAMAPAAAGLPAQRDHYRPSGPRPLKMPVPAPTPEKPKTPPTQPGGGFRDRRSTPVPVVEAAAPTPAPASSAIVEPIGGFPKPARPENKRQVCLEPDDIPW